MIINKVKYQLLWILLISPLVQGEVIFDGSIRPNLAGTTRTGDFVIGESDGVISGNNLFHSFSTFNVNAGESASFTHNSPQLNHIIARVTGNSQSYINGEINSSASLWLINTNGLIFGENAQLDINGSFYGSTADYLAFTNNDRFYSEAQASSSLSIAEPSTFGFLSTPPGNITLENSHLTLTHDNNLSLIGGDILLENSVIETASGHISTIALNTNEGVTLNMDQGHNLTTGTAIFGDITLINSQLVTQDAIAGNIFIIGDKLLASQNSTISSTNVGDDLATPNSLQQISLNVNSLQLQNNSNIFSDTENQYTGHDISISSETIEISGNSYIKTKTSSDIADSGDIDLVTNALSIGDNIDNSTSGILIESHSAGDAGNLVIVADTITVTNGGRIGNRGFRSGHGGNVDIEANQIHITNRGIIGITVPVAAAGNAGTLTILSDQLFISGEGSPDQTLTGISAQTLGTGNGGNIIVDSDIIDIVYGGSISATTFESAFDGGNAGNIYLKADSLLIDRASANHFTGVSAGTETNGNGGQINLELSEVTINGNGQPLAGIATQSTGSGNAGSIVLSADNLTLFDGGGISVDNTIGIGNGGSIQLDINNLLSLTNNATIASDTNSSGNAGSVHITAGELELSTSHISSFSTGSGQSGNITIDSDRVSLNDGATISTETSADTRSNLVSNISINSNYLLLENNSAISTRATNIADAGTINLMINGNLHAIDNSYIISESNQSGGGEIMIIADGIMQLENSRISTSVSLGGGNGGNVTINPTIILLKQAVITANANQGRGGNINIGGNHVIQSPDTQIQASSRVNIDGAINITANEFDSNQLSKLSIPTLNVFSLLSSKCTQEKNRSYLALDLQNLNTVPSEKNYIDSAIPRRKETIPGDANNITRFQVPKYLLVSCSLSV